MNVERERGVFCASVMKPPNQPGGTANITVKKQWEYCGTNDVEMMSWPTNE